MTLPFIQSHFPELTEKQCALLSSYAALLREWNEKINLVSRRDIDAFELHHLAPSLVLARALAPYGNKPYTLWDIGTGGGIPGIPVAILYPSLRCVLIDSTQKKIKAVQDMVARLGLKNVTCRAERVEAIRTPADIVIGRGVSALPEFIKLARFGPRSPKTLFYLTGATVPAPHVYGWSITETPLVDTLPDPHFEGKVLVSAFIRGRAS